MSAPQTDPEKQRRYHIGPILGIIVVVILSILGFLWWFDVETTDPDIPGEVTGPADEISTPPAEALENTPPTGEAAPQ